MLSRAELKEIGAMDGKGYFVSLYLNVDPIFNKRGDYLVHFKNMMKDTKERLEKEVYRRVGPALEKIEDYLLASKRLFKKGLVILSGEDDSFWKEYHLNLPVKNEIVVDRFPYIKPLTDILDNYQRYCVLLVDRERARIFVVHLGEIVEYGEVHTPDVPGRHKKGGWFALSQDHYERHIDYHVGLHLKDVLDRLAQFMSGEYIGRLILGGSVEAVTMVKKMLPGEFKEKVIGTVNVELFAKPDEVLRRVEPILLEYERKKEAEEVKRLIETALKRGPAALGLEDVLNALQEKRVMKLLISRDLQATGYACGNCGFLTPQPLKDCPYCKTEMTHVEDIVALAGERAIQQDALVEVLLGDFEDLKRYGSIGAFLRF